jgi:arsenate reductase (glutaredoxin)
MTADLVLWFDARCSWCKRAVDLLRQRGLDPTLRRFLEEPPTPDELRVLLRRLGLAAHDLARRDADEYQALRLSSRTPEEELIAAFCRHPRILRAPILVRGDRAVLARPLERILELVDLAA